MNSNSTNNTENGGGHNRKPSFFNSKKGGQITDQPQVNSTIVPATITTAATSLAATNDTTNAFVIGKAQQDDKGTSVPNRTGFANGHHQHSQSVGGSSSTSPQKLPFGNSSQFQHQTSIEQDSTNLKDINKKVQLNKQRIQNEKLPQYNVTDGDFSNFPEISQRTVDKFKARGITGLFPIQQDTFYPIYCREDVIARDLTGSGKTIAFGLPMIEYLRKNKFLGQRKLQAILLAPTRELAIQVQNELSLLKHGDLEYKTLTVYGGVPIDDQARELKYGVDIIVGTAGRIKDHIERGNIDFSHIKSFILDEADRMLDLGFKDDIEWIMQQITKQCQFDVQKCLFSATIPLWVKNVARQYLKPNYRLVDLAQNLTNKTAKSVEHLAICCPEQNKMAALADLLICYGGDGRSIVFTQTKVDANALILTDKIKLDIEVMHGDIPQNQREVTLKRFRDGKFSVLVATDVASRGLDIPNVDLVIQIEPPNEVETYIHRSGRTARAGKVGTCITFYQKKNQYMISMIESKAGIKFKNIGIPQPEDVIRASSKVMLKNLEAVNNQVLPFFAEASRQLIEQCKGDAEQALCKALAYISGHYKTAIQSRSLITGQERQLTLELKTTTGQPWRDPVSTAVQIFKKHFPEKIIDHLRGMKGKVDRSGIVFDIDENQADRFLEIGLHLTESDSTIDFELSKCLALPDLQDGEQQQSWGRGNTNDGDFRGGKHNRHQSYNVTGSSSGFGGGGFKNNQYGDDTRLGSSRGGYQGGVGRGGFHSRQGSGYGGGFVEKQQPQQNRSNMQSRKNSHVSNQDEDELHSYNDNDSQNDYGDEDTDPYNQTNFDVKIENNNNKFQKASGTGNNGKVPSKENSNSNIQKNNFDYNQKPKINDPKKTYPTQGCNKLFVGSIDFYKTEDDLHDLFQGLGLKVTKLTLLRQSDGRHKGAGFVEFATNEDADVAVNEIDGTLFGKQKIKLEYKKPQAK